MKIFNSRNLLYLVVFLMPFDIFQYTSLNLRPWNFVCLLGFIILLLNKFKEGEPFVAPLGSLFSLFFFSYILSLFNSTNITFSLMQMLKLIIIDLVLYIYVVNLIDSRKVLYTVYLILFGSGIVVGIAGIIQLISAWFFKLNLMWWWYNLMGPPAFFTEKTWFGNYFALLFSIFLAFYPLAKMKKPVASTLFLVFLLFCILISTTRSALIVIFSLFVLNELIVNYRCPMKLFRSILLILAMALFMLISLNQFAWIGDNILRTSSDVNMDRISRIEMVVKPIQEHPVIGNGIGTFGEVIGLTTRSPATFNVFLTVLFDSGIIGLVLVIILLSALAGYLFLLMRRKLPQVGDIYLLRAGLYMLFCIIIISQFHPFYMSGYAWLGFALIAATIRIIKKATHVK